MGIIRPFSNRIPSTFMKHTRAIRVCRQVIAEAVGTKLAPDCGSRPSCRTCENSIYGVPTIDRPIQVSDPDWQIVPYSRMEMVSTTHSDLVQPFRFNPSLKRTFQFPQFNTAKSILLQLLRNIWKKSLAFERLFGRAEGNIFCLYLNMLQWCYIVYI